LLLAAVGGIAFLKRLPAMSLERGPKPVVSLAGYALAIFIVSWVLSWGPYLQLCAACSKDKLNLPFLAIAKIIPGVENIRAPGRFAQFYGLPLGLMAVVSVRWTAMRLPLSRSAMAAALALIVLIDQMPKVRTFPFAVAHADFWEGAKALIEEGKPIIVLPTAGADHFQTMRNRGQQLVSSTIHWAKLVTGLGSRDTPEQNQLIGLDGQLRSGRGSLADIATYARNLGIDKIVLFSGDYPPEVQAQIAGEADRLEAPVLLKNSEGMILQLTKKGTSAAGN
jgi:hypothetical protein